MSETDDLIKAAVKLKTYCDNRLISYDDKACDSCIFAVDHKYRYACVLRGFPDGWKVANNEN